MSNKKDNLKKKAWEGYGTPKRYNGLTRNYAYDDTIEPEIELLRYEIIQHQKYIDRLKIRQDKDMADITDPIIMEMFLSTFDRELLFLKGSRKIMKKELKTLLKKK